MSDAAPVLEVEGLTKEFGGLVAVDDVSFEVREQSITGVIGPNGAGKSTTFDLISGFLSPTAGSVRLKGTPIDGLAPHRRAREGLVRTFQISRELRGMTVMENMLLGAPSPPDEAVVGALLTDPVATVAAERDRAEELLKLLDLWAERETYAGDLSGGQRKLLELGRSLMAEPDILLLDEPIAGVNPALSDEILTRLTSFREEGMTFLIIEHDIRRLMELSDEIVGMAEGRVIVQGEPEEVRQNQAFVEAYIGPEEA